MCDYDPEEARVEALIEECIERYLETYNPFESLEFPLSFHWRPDRSPQGQFADSMKWSLQATEGCRRAKHLRPSVKRLEKRLQEYHSEGKSLFTDPTVRQEMDVVVEQVEALIGRLKCLKTSRRDGFEDVVDEGAFQQEVKTASSLAEKLDKLFPTPPYRRITLELPPELEEMEGDEITLTLVAREAPAPKKKSMDDASDLSLEDKALAILFRNPGWTVKQIAEAVSCSRSSLYRMQQFRKASNSLKGGRLDMPKGSKDADGNVEAYYQHELPDLDEG